MNKQQQKFVRSLQQKKFRTETGLFLIEGTKTSVEVLNADYEIHSIFYTEKFYEQYQPLLQKIDCQQVLATAQQLEDSGSYQSNDSVIVLAKMKSEFQIKILEDEWILVLDEIRDPNNLGMILRIADWYGIKKIVCSPQTTELYNPKVIAASMGSFVRIQVAYQNLVDFLNNSQVQIFGTFMNGKNIHQTHFGKGGIIVMGNESNGINQEIGKLIQHQIHIPHFGQAESLNVATATAVVLDNVRRK